MQTAITRYWAWYPAKSPDLLVPLPTECEDDDYQIQTDPVKPPVFIFTQSASWAHSDVLKGYESVSLSSLQQTLAVAAGLEARTITFTFACDVSSRKTAPESSIPRSPFTWVETIEADPSSAQPGSSAGPSGEEDTPVTSFTFIREDGEGEIPMTGFPFVCENHSAAMVSARRTLPTRTSPNDPARATNLESGQEYDRLNDITDAILQDSEMEDSDGSVTGASRPLL